MKDWPELFNDKHCDQILNALPRIVIQTLYSSINLNLKLDRLENEKAMGLLPYLNYDIQEKYLLKNSLLGGITLYSISLFLSGTKSRLLPWPTKSVAEFEPFVRRSTPSFTLSTH